MNVARLNLSHGDHKTHEKRVALVREVNKELEFPVGLLFDLQGPKIRVLGVTQPQDIKKGDTITFTIKEGGSGILVDYPRLCDDVKKGDTILVDDGMIQFKVTETTASTVTCCAENNGTLKDRKSVNVPGVHLHLPAITKKDREDLLFAMKLNPDYIGLSFVKSKDDVEEVRKFLGEKKVQIIAKIECVEAVNAFDAILSAVDGVMIARGDLGVEVPLEKVPILQYDIIKKCNTAGKPVITATHLLNSMIDNPRPTRAEVSDVSNAIFTGSDALMLSGETATGSYPIESVKVLNQIACETEKRVRARFHKDYKTGSVGEIVARAVALVADSVRAKAILTLTQTGLTAQSLSTYRTSTPIFSITNNSLLSQAQHLRWGIFSVLLDTKKSPTEFVDEGIDALLKRGHIKKGDVVVITAGVLDGGRRNYAEVRVVGQ